MKRILIAICLLVLTPLMAQAYTLVLKDGRRVEVRSQYRIVNNTVAIFTMPEGNRFSIALDKIDVEKTEMANGEIAGAFVKNAIDPPKASDSGNEAKPSEEPIVASNAKPGSHKKLTNSDFERYRIRREEMSRAANEAAQAKAAAQLGVTALTGPAPDATAKTPAQLQAEQEEESMAQRREMLKKKEEYWRGRAKALLTQIRVEEEQLAVLAAQLEDARRQSLNNNPSVSIYQTDPYVYQPGIRIGGVPIGIGGIPRNPNTGNVVVINQNPNQNRSLTLQERFLQLQVQHQETLVRYEEMREEARKDGALPGWLR